MKTKKDSILTPLSKEMRDRKDELRKKVLHKILAGGWTPLTIGKFKVDYDLTKEELDVIASEARTLAKELNEYTGGIEELKEELVAKARKIYDAAFNRKGWADAGKRDLPPDLKAASQAITVIAKLSGLDVQKHEVVTADLTAQLQQLPIHVREYIALHGEPPPGVVLPGFQPRAALPAHVVPVVEPNGTDNGTDENDDPLTERKR
jgi:hypothetical protein